MNKVFALAALAAMTTFAHSQEANTSLRQLEQQLDQMGYSVSHEQSNAWAQGITHRWRAGIHILKGQLIGNEHLSASARRSLQQRLDSDHAQRARKAEEAIDAVRMTFAHLSRDAFESYLYECHKDGRDTIKYSLAFSQVGDTLYTSRHSNQVYFANAREAANFDFEQDNGTKEGDIGGGWGTYTHVHTTPFAQLSGVRPGFSWQTDMKPFDIPAFEALIQPALKPIKKLKGAETHPVYWRHDKGFKDDLDGGLTSMVQTSGTDHSGLTTGTYYFIPIQYEAEAEAIYRRLDSLAYDYVCRHTDQPYVYHFSDRFPALNLSEIVQGVTCYGSDEYQLSCKRDADGFHILSATTRGDLWVPREWWKLKSYINGERTYLKGREPKADGQNASESAIQMNASPIQVYVK